MARKSNPKPKAGTVHLSIMIPVELLKKVEERAKQLSPPGFEPSRSDAVRIVIAASLGGE